MVRPFNNYGPGMKITDGRVIADLFRDALAGRDLVLLSDGSPTRTFCYVADAVTGYYLALLRGRPGEAYNIGVDGPEIPMRELAAMIAGLANALFGHEVQGGPRTQLRGRLPGGQPQPSLPGHHQGQDGAAVPARSDADGGAPADDAVVQRQPQRGGALMRVAVVGTGYVGLVTAVGLAELGHTVVCIDVDQGKVAALDRGDPPIFERGLEELLRRHLGVRLRATTDLGAAVRDSELTFICVGTPSRADGGIDVSFVRLAAEQIGDALAEATGWHAVVVKSTVVPGTTDRIVVPALEGASGRRAGVDLGVGVNPEFLTEGQAVDDFLRPDRIVIGGDRRTVAALRVLYAGFQGVPVVETNAPTAEMIKYASNAMLATAISFSNEIANLGAEIGGIDAVEVMKGVHLSRYLTTPLGDGTWVTAPLSSFLEAGCGYGGSCLPKDVAALAARGREVGSPMRLLEAVAEVNDQQPARLVELLRRRLGRLAGRRVTVLGLAFKPDTDDVRSSPAVPGAPIAAGRRGRGQRARPRRRAGGARRVRRRRPTWTTWPTAVKQAEAVVIVTRWDHYQQVPELVGQVDPPPLVVDGRRMLDRASVPAYAGIGL